MYTRRGANSNATCLCLKRDWEGNSCRALAEEEGPCDNEGKERWTSCMDDENEDSASDMGESESPDLGDEWSNWRVDDPELESDEAAHEGLAKERKKNVKR